MVKRHAHFLEAARSQLLVVDIQEKLFGAMHPDGQANLLRNVPILAAAARELGVPVSVTEQYPKGLGRTLPGLQEELAGFPVFEKLTFAATEVGAVTDRLRGVGRPQVVLSGMETHICVYQTALGLLAEGFEVHVVADALAARFPSNHETGLDLMRAAGGLVTSTETVLFQWLERAGTDAFKKLQKRIL